ncbi:hypothetical protein BJY01DRAFT_259317 [Aspergillus pseudoustus]|uniref:Ankyrin repeat-containing domain protein n=1 Tax=Aspergillus pseudoustus TaxID=1810923 RepID=A0ABR4KPX0_9EURO
MASAGEYSHEDYTVAWLCALPVEMTAAEAMLDENHPSLPTQLGDHNTYILGRMFGHNVVISCFRSGVYGTTSAAIAATQLQFTFKCIRIFLMVGIGGGVPSDKADIRLGDVVVSKPTRDFGGVVQYDYGKTMAGDRFERTGVLNKPSSILLTAVSRLESAHRLSPGKIPKLISEMLQKYPTMAEHFTHRGHDQDKLFESDYVHRDRGACDKFSCSTERLVQRPPRCVSDPVIHYGLIASGNQVMKDAVKRDTLGRELGILCFEMETAGLMDDFQCLVIRGICDYSDSHKNKQWQGYAAATAAAYAKELLSIVHTVQVADAQPTSPDGVMQCQVSTYGDGHRSGEDHFENVIVRRTAREVPLSNISNYDEEKAHRRLVQKRLVGTTEWFLNHPDYAAWFKERKVSCLWCSGKIGSGKTIIATTAVEAAKYRYPGRFAPTLFFYCEDDDRETLDAAYILSSLVKQLCEFLLVTTRSYPPDMECEIRRFFGDKRMQPDLRDLQNILNLVLGYVSDVVCIIDGLDALNQEQTKGLLECMQRLCSSKRVEEFRVLLFSRDQIPGYINIATVIPGIRQIRTPGYVMPDIEVYIDSSIAEKTLYRRLTDNAALLDVVKQTLLDESLGMFLWVYLQLEILWDTCYTDAEIRTALATLPKGLDETYDRCMDRINSSDKYAMKVFKWVGFAMRPLHIDELREAVAFGFEDTKWDPERLPHKDVLIGCCANLVIVDYTERSVRFAHSSVKQYLKQYPGKIHHPSPDVTYPSAEEGDLECGELCITYLSFSDFGLELTTAHQVDNKAISVPSPALLAKEAVFGHNRLTNLLFSRFAGQKHDIINPALRIISTPSTPNTTRYKFLNYAVTNWALHTKKIHDTSRTWGKFQILATTFNETWNFHPWLPGGRSRDSLLHGLFSWAVIEQHEPLFTLAVSAGPSLPRVCDLPLVGQTLPALHIACKLGHQRITRVLLELCDVTVRDEEGYTALHHAASGGHADLCQWLLSKDKVKVNALSETKRTPLWLAASNGHNEVVSLLLANGSNIETKEDGATVGQLSPGTPVAFAVVNGHAAVVESLLERSARVKRKAIAQNSDLGHLLIVAAMEGHEAVVELLLDKGDHIVFRRHGDYGTALAAIRGHEAVADILLNRGVPLEGRTSKGRTPLAHAAAFGQLSIVKLLLQKGADPEARDENNQTPSELAAQSGHVAIADILLESQRTQYGTMIGNRIRPRSNGKIAGWHTRRPGVLG